MIKNVDKQYIKRGTTEVIMKNINLFKAIRVVRHDRATLLFALERRWKIR